MPRRVADQFAGTLDQRETRLRRLSFRCWHRGTQEIDLIFGSFVDSAASQLSAVQLDRLEALLDCDDTDLFDWVVGQTAPPPAHDHDVTDMLRCSYSRQKG